MLPNVELLYSNAHFCGPVAEMHILALRVLEDAFKACEVPLRCAVEVVAATSFCLL